VNNIGGQLLPLIGRTRELADIQNQLADPDCRLLTLVGPGGIGKTRLALEIARQSNFPNDANFVPLQPLTSPEFIVSAIADAMDFQFYGAGDPKQQLLAYLREKSLLLILDNFEHLMEGAPLLSDIHTASPDVRMLVTSRERLNLREEWVYEVSGLAFPNATESGIEAYDAVRLFVQNARRTNASFALTADKMPDVARICRMVGGMPLGIELAAAWVRALSCKAIADEIEQGLDILETQARNIEPRHRTMRAALEPTWARLSDEERKVFMQLSVFRGGFTREAGESVAGASRRILASLVDKSLVQLDTSGRYSLHELLRQYGEEHLQAESDTWQQAHDRHCHYFANFLQRRWEHLTGSRATEAMWEIEAELKNIRAYWQWAVSQPKFAEIEAGLDSLWYFYDRGSHFHEGEKFFAQAAAMLKSDSLDTPRRMLLAKVLARQGSLLASLVRYDEALRLLQESVNILRESDALNELAFALFRMGLTVFQAGKHNESLRYFQESLDLYRQVEDGWGIGLTHFWKGIIHQFNGEIEEAWQIYQQSLTILEDLGNSIGIAAVKAQLSMIAITMGNVSEARRLVEEALQLFHEAGVVWGIQYSYDILTRVMLASDDFIEAGRYVLRALAIAIEYDLRNSILVAIGRTARLRNLQKRYQEAVEIMGLFQTYLNERDNAIYAPLLAELKTKIPLDSFEATFERGKLRDINEMAKELLAKLRQEVEAEEQTDRAPQSLPEPLSERELEILRLIADGFSNREIAEQLVVALSTVKWHINQIYSKLDVDSRTRAAARARELNILT
jgi:predicted ATPase/DNA-binding CsgD family transcriptional regulator